MPYRKINYSPEALLRRKEYQRQYARAQRQTTTGREKSVQAWKKCNTKFSPEEKREKACIATMRWRANALGTTLEEVLRLFDGGCMICGKKTLKGRRYRILCLDHDHKTGKFRGILCCACNTALGQFDDDPRMLERAARYLRGEL